MYFYNLGGFLSICHLSPPESCFLRGMWSMVSPACIALLLSHRCVLQASQTLVMVRCCCCSHTSQVPLLGHRRTFQIISPP